MKVDPAHKHVVADQVFAQLLAGKQATIADLGSFEIREYKAYQGRNPRSGGNVQVPAGKRLPFFMLDSVMREHVNGSGPSPATPWVAALLDELRAGTPVVFGRLGALRLRRKPERVGRNPQSGESIVVPERVVLTFQASVQLKRRLSGAATADVRTVEPTAVDAALAKLPAVLPRTIVELDAAVASLALDHRSAGLVEPAKRRPDSAGEIVLVTNEDGEPHWALAGTKVVHRGGDELEEVSIERWTAGMLVVAAVRSSANGGVLDVVAAERVLARLGPDSPFTLADVPY